MSVDNPILIGREAAIKAAERVARGAAWLDANVPGWETRIDLYEFDISSACKCVFGQVFTNEARSSRHYDGYMFAMYWVEKVDAELKAMRDERNGRVWPAHMGFDHDHQVHYDYLQDAWRNELSLRGFSA